MKKIMVDDFDIEVVKSGDLGLFLAESDDQGKVGDTHRVELAADETNP